MKIREGEHGPKPVNFLIEKIQINFKYLILGLVHPIFVPEEID